uniref:RIIa domain-containing protein n=1 Tax=Alexandrium monilatum TaxID=311494 RepID=A0A7S4WIT4_9DINO
MSEAYRLKRQAYVKEKLDPVLHPLVAALLEEMPANPREFARQWLRQRQLQSALPAQIVGRPARLPGPLRAPRLPGRVRPVGFPRSNPVALPEAVSFKEERLPCGGRRRSYWGSASAVAPLGPRPGAAAGPAAAAGDFGLPAASEPAPPGDQAPPERPAQAHGDVQFHEEAVEGGGRRKTYRGRQSVVLALGQQPEPKGRGGADDAGGRRASAAEATGDFGLPPPEEAGDSEGAEAAAA